MFYNDGYTTINSELSLHKRVILKKNKSKKVSKMNFTN